jgi:16S rRNA (cytosine967-C5)-methyltransferase
MPCCASACCSSTWRKSGNGALERRLALLAWQGSEAFLRGAPRRQRTGSGWNTVAARIDRATCPSAKLRHNLPDWLAERLA